jgi:polysaccharide transporter, PST family
MINKLKTTIYKNKLLFENFMSLSALQTAGYIIPLITLPYLVRVLGPEKFGLVMFAQAFATYFVLLTEYGFKLSATREVSINRNNKEKISEIFCSVYFVKMTLLLISFLIFTTLVFSIPRFNVEHLVFMFSFIMVLGNLIFPVWLFQGMEKMKYITIINVLVKTVFVIPIFLFIKSQSDYAYVPLINSLGFLVSGIIAFYWGIKIFRIKLFLPSVQHIVHQFKEGWYIFISTIAISLYTTSNVFILGLFTNNTIVGYYSAAEKLINAARGLLHPVSQSIYPHISRLASESKEKALIFIKKLIKIIGGGTLILSLIIFILATPIINLALGSQYQQSIVILRILASLPFIIGLSNIFGIQLLLPFNIKKLFTLSIVIPSILHIALLFFVSFLYKEIGVAILVIFTETSILLFRVGGIYLFHKDLLRGIYYEKK